MKERRDMDSFDKLIHFFFAVIVSILSCFAIETLFISPRYRKVLVECGKAHYDTVTGEFVQHGKEGK